MTRRTASISLTLGFCKSRRMLCGEREEGRSQDCPGPSAEQGSPKEEHCTFSCSSKGFQWPYNKAKGTQAKENTVRIRFSLIPERPWRHPMKRAPSREDSQGEPRQVPPLSSTVGLSIPCPSHSSLTAPLEGDQGPEIVPLKQQKDGLSACPTARRPQASLSSRDKSLLLEQPLPPSFPPTSCDGGIQRRWFS